MVIHLPRSMKNITFRKVYPYLIALGIFVVLTIAYMFPVFEGKAIQASDMINFRGMSKEIVDFREKTGEEPLWTNAMFSGMPAYLVSTKFPAILVSHIDRILQLGLPHPVGLVFLYFLGFFILLLTLRVDKWTSIVGALAFALSSYFFIILEAGHNSKAHAIGYMAPVLAGIILTYRGRYLLGGVLAALFLSLEIYAYHLQITYYLLIIVIFLAIAEIVKTIRQKTYLHFIKASAVLILAAVLAAGVNTSRLWTALEQSKYSIRNKSELTFNEADQTSGLDKSYATAWSYGRTETLTLLYPNLYGGSSTGSLGENSETYGILSENNVPNSRQIIRQLPLYWGDQPFTSGPVYVGAVVLFLFVAGLFLVKGSVKWWILGATVLSVLLSWGHHFMPLTDFFLDHVPGYNKFRAVSMTLVIAELTIPLLAFLALKQIFDDQKDKSEIKKVLKFTFAFLGGLSLLLLVFAGSLFSFSGPSDGQYGLPDWLLDALRSDRLRMLRMDTLRALVFITLAFGMLWLYLAGKIKKPFLLVGLGLVILVDMWPVNKRYFNAEDFVRKSMVEKPFQAGVADQKILQDKASHFRVWNLTEDFDKSARTSYFHRNIGGYHAAKLRRYQELYDYRISMERAKLVEQFSGPLDLLSLDLTLSQLNAINMLNTRYIIYNPDSEPLINSHALGSAWFVREARLVEDADQEILSLNDIDPRETVIVNQSYEEQLSGISPVADTAAVITLTGYQPNYLSYQSKSVAEQPVVFSEIYYPKGWNAYIDGELSSYFRANFVLRGMVVPAGSHTIEFKFEPRAYHLGETISLTGSLVLVILLLVVVYLGIRKGLDTESAPNKSK